MENAETNPINYIQVDSENTKCKIKYDGKVVEITDKDDIIEIKKVMKNDSNRSIFESEYIKFEKKYGKLND